MRHQQVSPLHNRKAVSRELSICRSAGAVRDRVGGGQPGQAAADPRQSSTLQSSTMDSPGPTVQQWQRLWQLWDAAVLVMVPRERHCDRPLELRQPFIFYIGHLPAFTDARLARVLQQQLTEPAHYADMFARGIDPDLDDPTQCHSHSPTPAQWPPLEDILAYRDRVRARILQLYSGDSSRSNNHAAAASHAAVNSGSCNSSIQRQQQHTCNRSKADSGSCCQVQLPRGAVASEAAVIAAMPAAVQHVLWMSYEHEAMHLETLMYLLVQYDAVQPPPADVLAAAAVPAAAWRSDLAAAAAGVATLGNARNNSSSASSNIAIGSAESVNLSAVSKVGSTAGQLLPQPPAAAWVNISPSHVTLGFDAQSNSSIGSDTAASNGSAAANNNSSSGGRSRSRDKPLQFGWDNECPARQVSVPGFKIQHRPVTVLEYLQFMACEVAGSCTAAAKSLAVNRSYRSCPASAIHAAPAGAEDGDTACACVLQSSSSSMTLPQLLSELRGSKRPACTGCQQTVSGLLQQWPVQALLPASLALLQHQCCHADSKQDIGSISNGGTAGDISGGLSVPLGCSGLCQVMKPPRHSTNGSSTGGTQQPAHLQGLQGTVQAALLQHLGVKTVFGLVPISIAGHWPVYCSALQAEQYAAWASTPAQTYRLPTEPQLLAVRQHNSRLSQTPDRAPTSNPDQLTSTATGADFAAWHPLCVNLLPGTPGSPSSSSSNSGTVPHADDAITGSNASDSTTSAGCSTASPAAAGSPAGGCAVSQLGDNGWEWTCSVFDRHEGFEAHPLYPEYSQDFFGGKHVVLLGGSWATLSSIAGRPTFRNWYQRGQQHVFAKFRLVHV